MSKLITQLIHQTNHTITDKYAVLSSNNIDEQSIKTISYRNDKTYHLDIGVYRVSINGIFYIFHNYIPTITENSILYIESPNNAYIQINNERFIVMLYKVIETKDDDIQSLNNTVNNFIDLMIINGHSYSEIINGLLLKDIIFYYPKNDNYQILSYNPLLEQESQNNIILNNFNITNNILEDSSSLQNNTILLNDVVSIMNENANESLRSVDINSNNLDNNYNSIYDIDFIELSHGATSEDDSDNVRAIRSINKIKLETSDQNGNNNIIYLELKNCIRNLPNSVHDTLIINAEQQICQVIHRIAKRIFIGSDNWTYVSSNSKTVLFSLNDDTIKQENNDLANYNIRCSHFICNKCSTLVDENYETIGIATMYGDYGNGIFVRVPINIIDMNDKVNSFNKWIINELYNGRIFMIEYELTKPIYKTYLLDEYHIKTFYPITNINNMNDYDISYCYKSLIVRSE